MKFRSVKYFIWSFKNRKSLKNWRARNFSSPSPDVIKNQILINNNLKDSLWIETGTYYGETTKLLSKISKKIISIEADKNLFEISNKILKNFKNVEILNGKSEDLLDKVISKNLNFKNVCIYLDAHLCQDHLKNTKTFGNENTATPILNELEIITKYLANFEKIVVLIDDIRLFQGKFQNYPNKNTLVKWCKENDFLWEIEQDIFICKKI
ncbi:hypothetical protein N9U89_02815 [Candidatus Pelagibacter sp.]|nr:hypothetical protein [Candidatus Pelagibacter sp.]